MTDPRNSSTGSSSKPVDPSKSSAGSSAAANPPSPGPNPVQSAPAFPPGVAAPNAVDGTSSHHHAAAGGVETISVTVAPFTGGPFVVTVRKTDSVEELKRAVAKKLKVLKDRICLLYRER